MKNDTRRIFRILFVCHGNICRSAMAEYLMKDMVKKAGCADMFYIESATTSTEELGNPVYPPAWRILNQHGIDRRNIQNMNRAFLGDPDEKIHLLSEYAHFSGEVEDPWYTGNFEKVFEEIRDGVEGLMEVILG